MNVRHGTAADPPGTYIHDTSSAAPPSKFRILPLQTWELLMY